ncbi:hypothetical protein CGC20_4880 [Leishmania donovani]|uniref:Uncharacterized protein n=2 Tax=Leishmania donovani TaxID=5661 RepID=A0A504XWH4_LEIDO|nr:hypothetical protein CGC20_4880 [Leishmania donovani]
MHSFTSNNTPSPQSATHRHTNHSATNTSSLLPPTASPVLQASCMDAKEDQIDADAQGIPSSVLSTSKARISAVPTSTESPPSRGAAYQHAPAGSINVSAATGATAVQHSDSGSSTAAPTASSSSPPPQKQQSQHLKPAAYPGKLDDAPHAVNDNIEAVIINKGRICTLAYFPSSGNFRITHVSSTGKTRVVLNIPVRTIINIETAAERDARQRARQANDDTVKLAFAENGRNTGGLLCTFPSGADEDNETVVFAHSRVNTASFTLRLLGGPSPTPTASHFGTHTAACAVTTAVPSIRYYAHYVQQRNKENPSIRTLEFQSSGPAETVQHVVSTVVQRIYQKGSKHIIAFISAKSGKGKGEHIFEKQVRPVLHFSRHTYQAHVTRRAHDCEDYVANLENPMNSNTVIAAVGGDGMIHETVNGVHRRKLALVRWLRSVTAEGSTGGTSAVSPNVSAHLNEETCAAVTLKSGGANKVAPHGEASVGSPSPFIQLGCEENKRNGYGGNGATPSAEATAREAYRLARCLVQDGWDALMPLVATVATGSACGLAKSLDVLSVAEAALSLVHLSTVHMDLLLMNFTPNEDMVEFHRRRMSASRLDAAQREFSQYKEDKAAELQERLRLREALQLPPRMLTAADCMTPFLKDGSNVYRDAVSCATRMPELHSRVAFMSLSFGAANDIDHGSESLRWMGNARFHVYGGYMILRGLKRYKGMLRYLPWESKAGKTVEKLHTRCKIPSTDDFPLCTMRESCPHCRQYVFAHCGAPSLSSMQGNDTHPGPTPNTSRGAAQPISAAEALAPYTDQQLLDEDAVDFKDERLPWVTIRGDFCIALLCNVRDVAQDMLMAPLAHMSDGAIDVVYCRVDPTTGRGGRMEMLKFFMGLESGAHVNLDFVNYVKARALEIKVDAGISMSDGELMPLSSVRVTKMRGSVQLVRSGDITAIMRGRWSLVPDFVVRHRRRDVVVSRGRALNTAQMLDAVLALSSALYEDEAAATAARVNDAKAPSNAADHPVSSPHVPPMTSYRALGELEGVTAVPEDAYGSLDAEDLMTSMGACSEGCGDKRDKRTLHIDLATNSPAPSFSSAVIAQPSSTGTTSSSIVATFAARDVPLERKVLQFMDLCSNSSATPHLSGDHSDAASQLPWNGGAGARAGDSRRDRTTPSAATAWSSSAAAALVLPGLDMKAILAHGVLENRHLRGLSLVRCDFSLVRWSHVTLEDCDLSRSLFYGAKLDTVIFRRCNFTGCILKGVQCRPSLSTTARFEDCDFRLAAVGLTCIPHDSRQTGKDADQGQGIICSSSRRDGPSVCFLRCNFDLSDFQFSQGLDKAKFGGAAVPPTVTATAAGSTREDPWPQMEKQVGGMLADLNAQMQRFRDTAMPTVIAENELLEAVGGCSEAVEDMRFALDTAMEHPESFAITAEELQSRAERIRGWERDMMKAQQVAEKVKAAQRKRIMAQDGDIGDGGVRENSDFLRQEHDIQLSMMQQDDQTLDRLSSGIHRVKDTAVNIQDELNTQEHILDDIDRGMTRVQMRLEGAMRKVSKLIDSTKGTVTYYGQLRLPPTYLRHPDCFEALNDIQPGSVLLYNGQHRFVVPTARDGSFSVYKLPYGTYILQAEYHYFMFPTVRVEVMYRDTGDDQKETFIRTSANDYPVRHLEGSGLDEESPAVIPFSGYHNYYIPRQQMDIVSLLKSPMVIMLLVSVSLMGLMKLFPEEEIRESQKMTREWQKKLVKSVSTDKTGAKLPTITKRDASFDGNNPSREMEGVEEANPESYFDLLGKYVRIRPEMQQRLVVGKVNAPNEARIQRRYKVSGYPTVIMVPPNKHAGVEFTGNRNFNQLLDFCG